MTREEFQILYTECLAEAVRADPTLYYYPPEEAPRVVSWICAVMATKGARSVNITGSGGFKRMAKRLGIKHTVRDIAALWEACT